MLFSNVFFLCQILDNLYIFLKTFLLKDIERTSSILRRMNASCCNINLPYKMINKILYASLLTYLNKNKISSSLTINRVSEDYTDITEFEICWQFIKWYFWKLQLEVYI